MRPDQAKPIAGRFWALVQKTDGCWLWLGTRHTERRWGLVKKTYGKIYVGSRSDGSRRCIHAHVLAFELMKGPVQAGKQVLHHCDNPQCVNPGHLYLGSHKQNMRDMVMRGRSWHPRGEKHGAAKLTDSKVRKIRKLLPSMYQREIAERFGVTQTMISRIARGTAWAHVEVQ